MLSLPMPIPIPMPRCRCQDFQMAKENLKLTSYCQLLAVTDQRTGRYFQYWSIDNAVLHSISS